MPGKSLERPILPLLSVALLSSPCSASPLKAKAPDLLQEQAISAKKSDDKTIEERAINLNRQILSNPNANQKLLAERRNAIYAIYRSDKRASLINLLEKYKKENPRNLADRMFLAYLYSISNTDLAEREITYLEQELKTTPNPYLSSELLYYKARLNLSAGESTEALSLMRKYIRTKKTPEAYCELAMAVFLKQKDSELAELLLDRAKKLAPEIPESHNVKAELYYAIDKFEAALNEIDCYLRSVPLDLNASNRRVKILMKLGHDDEAKLLISKNYELPFNSNAHLLKVAIVYEIAEKPKKAYDCLSELIKRDPKNPGYWYRRAFVLHHIYMDELALKDCNQALKLKPAFEAAAKLKEDCINKKEQKMVGELLEF
ncbi:MAG: hypothetical protein K2X27_15325 [Candidatus Obscuribacterales bacterium]|nr:hypothetical protein [Candidatus Obscuribacterales bacterium]